MYCQRIEKQYQSDRQCVLSEAVTQSILTDSQLEELISQYAAERKQRTDEFVELVRCKRNQYLERLCPV